MALRREVALFAAGGVIGLIVDAGIVQLLVGVFGWNPYGARAPSFLLAATVTWWWHRHYSFAGRSSRRKVHAEWLHWIALMSIGAAVNYGVYALMLALVPSTQRWPAIAVAAGAGVAALINFSAARGVLFKHPETPA